MVLAWSTFLTNNNAVPQTARFGSEGRAKFDMTTPVLICDDSSVARKQMARTLSEGWDFNLSFASNGAEAIEAIKAGKGDVLLLDLNMPVMDGYETLETIRREELDTMVIVVSGDIQPDAKERVLKLGALAFIKKPTVQEEVYEVLTQYGLVRDESAVATSAEVEIGETMDLRDCCQEVANVAMGQAADLLARLLDVFVVLPVPNVNLLESSELAMTLGATADRDSASVVSQGFVGGGIAGEALLLIYDSSFEDVARLMKHEGEVDDAVERELLMDIASILIGACINGIAEQVDVSFSQGHPIILGQHVDIVELVKKNNGSKTLAIEISYSIENFNINFDLLLLITEDSLDTINKKLSFMME